MLLILESTDSVCQEGQILSNVYRLLGAEQINSVVNKNLFKFYVTYSKPQYEVWSLKKIVVVKKCEEAKVDGYTNNKFTMVRGLSNEESEFTFAELPIMNPYD